MPPRHPLLSSLLLAGVAGCAGTGAGPGPGKQPKEALDPSEVAEGRGVLPGTSARCNGGACACRPIDDYGRGTDPAADAESAPPPEGWKRFELRTGRGADTLRITIEGQGTYEKSGDSVEPGCIYVDLPPGVHRVRYHVIARDPGQGVEPRLRVSEYSSTFRAWYRTFAFRCASGSEPCTKDDARDAVQALAKVPKGKHDPCGSTKVQGLRFFTERPADAQVADFNLQFVLNVYKFTPRFPPGEKSCKGTTIGSGGEGGE